MTNKKFKITYYVRDTENGEELREVYANNWIEDMLAGQYIIYIEGIDTEDDDCIIIPEGNLREIRQLYGVRKDKQEFQQRRQQKQEEIIKRKKTSSGVDVV